MTYKITGSATPLNAVNCAKHILSHGARLKQFTYDFSDMQHCRPFGLLMLASAIRTNIRRYPHAKHTPINYDRTKGCGYAAHLGFFQSIEADGWNIGRIPDNEDTGTTFIPIKKVTIKELQQNYLHDTYMLNEMVDRYAGELSLILTQDADCQAYKVLRFCIREIMRNTFEHSGANELWICGQFWPTKNEAEIAILDEGKGIFQSLKSNRRFTIRNDSDANKLALQPGVSRTLGLKQDPFDVWQNSGFGLYMASSISCICEGYFCLCSGLDATLSNSDSQHNYEANMKGTSVGLSLHTNTISDADTMLTNIAQEGERQAKEHGDMRIVTASKVSSVASMMRHVIDNRDKE